MSSISIYLVGQDGSWSFHNDWDLCEKTGSLHIEDFDGWIGGVDSTLTPDLKRWRRHGKFPGASIRGARKMDLTLTWHKCIAPGSDGYTIYSRIASGIAWDTGPYVMTVVENGLTLSAFVQLDGTPQHAPAVKNSEDAFRIKIPLQATDPFIYGPEQRYTVRPFTGQQALEYPLFGQNLKTPAGLDVVSWRSSTGSSPTITNNGNATSYPKFVVVADAPGGVRVTLNGESVEYREPLFPQSPVLIDMRGSVTINGIDRSENLVARGWSGIPGRGGTATPSINFPGGGGGFAEAIHRDTYI